MPKFSKKYKLFLWIPDTKEIYVKLFTNSSQNSEKYTKSTQNCCNKKGRRRRRPCTRVPRQNETAPASHAERNGGSSASAPLLVNRRGPHEQSLSPLLMYTLHYSAVDTQPGRAGRLRGSLERSRGERRGRPRGRSYPVGSLSTAEGGRARRIEHHLMTKKQVDRCP